ncbi:MAG: hypothetical protein IJ841_06275 [Prevotella sp.]|nr:hypothetical protein [Prevotella sp.]
MRQLLLCLLLLLATTAGAWRDDFDGPGLSPLWQHIDSVDATKYRLQGSQLRLYGSIFQLFEQSPTTFIGQPLDGTATTFETRLTLFDAESGDEAGISLLRSRQCYVQCCLNNFKGDHRLKLRLHLYGRSLLLKDQSVGLKREVWLRAQLSSKGRHYNFHYSFDGQKYHWLESVEVQLLSPCVAQSDGPLLAGLYAFMGSAKYQAGYSYACFDYAELR